MNLEQLEAVNAVVEKGTFRAAAEHLKRSQPALSTTIKNLEEEFGILIFDRNEYRPKLTEAGAAFLSVARETLNSARYTARVAFELGNNRMETKLHISIDPLVSVEFIELIAHECARPVLPVDLIISKTILKSGYRDLLDGKVDLALAACPRDEKQLERIVLESTSLVGVVSRKLLQEKRRPSKDFLAKSAQILVYDKQVDEPPDELLPNPTLKVSGHKIFVPDHFMKLRLIEAGIGWGRVSRMEFDSGKGLVMIDKGLCEPITFELCLLRAKHRPIGPAARVVWEAFQKKMTLSKPKPWR